MQEVMAVALRAMQQDGSRLERVSANLANALTPSYKREMIVQRLASVSAPSFTQAFEQVAQQNDLAMSSPLTSVDVVRDVRTGTLRATHQNLDLALAGPGFFEISTEHGPAYTRDGQFQLDARGRLVTARGMPVMGVSGEIVLTNGQPTIDAGGVVSDNGRMVDRIKIIGFDDGAELKILEGGVFEAGKGAKLLSEQDVQLRQGFLENSNVNSSSEMVQMIQAMRHFESMQKVVQGYDDMVGSAIRKLGDL